MTTPVYEISTWCTDSQTFTPQTGCPAVVTGPGELRRAIRMLRDMGYIGRREDPSLLVERVESMNNLAYTARCPNCNRVVFAAANRGVDGNEIGRFIADGFSVERMTDEQVRDATWGHSEECEFATETCGGRPFFDNSRNVSEL